MITFPCFLHFPQVLFLIEKIYQDSISLAIQSPRISKIIHCASYFQFSSFCWDIPRYGGPQLSRQNKKSWHYKLNSRQDVLSDGKTKLINGSTQLIHGKTKLTHGRTQLVHGKTKLTHGRTHLTHKTFAKSVVSVVKVGFSI